MKIAILSREPRNYSTRRLVEVAQARGHQVEVLDTLRCYMNIASHSPSIHYEGRELESYDAVIPRIGASITFYGTAVLRQFEMMNTMALNSSVAISRSRDKLRAMQLLSRHGIGLPITGYAHSTHDVPDLITMVGGGPPGSEAAGRHPGNWRCVVRDPQGGRERDRGLYPDQQQHLGAGVHP